MQSADRNNKIVKYTGGSIVRLKDKVIIITGAGRGIGRSAAIALAKNGARVAVIAKTVEEDQFHC